MNENRLTGRLNTLCNFFKNKDYQRILFSKNPQLNINIYCRNQIAEIKGICNLLQLITEITYEETDFLPKVYIKIYDKKAFEFMKGK